MGLLHKSLGFMEAQEAFSHGFTHHGRYLGMPVWVGAPFGTTCMAAKWAPLELGVVCLWMAQCLLHQLYGSGKAEFVPSPSRGAEIRPISPFYEKK